MITKEQKDTIFVLAGVTLFVFLLSIAGKKSFNGSHLKMPTSFKGKTASDRAKESIMVHKAFSLALADNVDQTTLDELNAETEKQYKMACELQKSGKIAIRDLVNGKIIYSA